MEKLGTGTSSRAKLSSWREDLASALKITHTTRARVLRCFPGSKSSIWYLWLILKCLSLALIPPLKFRCKYPASISMYPPECPDFMNVSNWSTFSTLHTHLVPGLSSFQWQIHLSCCSGQMPGSHLCFVYFLSTPHSEKPTNCWKDLSALYFFLSSPVPAGSSLTC